jgi:hypothetical protein
MTWAQLWEQQWFWRTHPAQEVSISQDTGSHNGSKRNHIRNFSSILAGSDEKIYLAHNKWIFTLNFEFNTDRLCQQIETFKIISGKNLHRK